MNSTAWRLRAAVILATVAAAPAMLASPAVADDVDVVLDNRNYYNPCGTEFDGVSIGANADQYDGVDVDDWEFSLDGGTTWNPYYADEYATAPPDPKFGGKSYYVLTQGASVALFRALDVNGNNYFGSVAIPSDISECSEDPDYTDILPLIGGALDDGPGLADDSFTVPTAVLGPMVFWNDTMAISNAAGGWTEWTPNVSMTLADLGYTNASVPPGGSLIVYVKHSGGGTEVGSPIGDGAQYMNQATNNPDVDYLQEVSFGHGHLVFSNAQPSATDDVATANGAPVTIAVIGNDTPIVGYPVESVSLLDSDANPVTSLITPEGTYTVVGLTVEFTPAPGFSGTAPSVPYRITDTYGLTADATITVTVNVPPVANDDTATSNEGATVTIPVIGNDTTQPGTTITNVTLLDSGGDPVTTLVTPEGTYTVVGLTVECSPTPGFTGTAPSVPYRITDTNGLTATATITVTVTASVVTTTSTTSTTSTTPTTSTDTTTPAGETPTGNLPVTGSDSGGGLVLGAIVMLVGI
ncbi:MAG TPA: Ig-like domain-containing protein, partial [Ilumatobacteraceae bacterium]|nr:Ig-like domain-containing protein [Ilumatobacteraceae bacterium]